MTGKDYLMLSMIGLSMVNKHNSKYVLPEVKTKVISSGIKRSRKLRRLEKKQEKAIRQEASEKSHKLLIERRKRANFKKHNKTIF